MDKILNAGTQNWFEKLWKVLPIQDKRNGTVKTYKSRLILLLKTYDGKIVANENAFYNIFYIIGDGGYSTHNGKTIENSQLL